MDKSSIIEFFLVEAGEHLQNLNKGLLSLEKDAADREMIDELFRAAHTLKGSAAMMGYPGISDVAHKAEDMLSQFRSGSLPIRKDTLNFLFDSVDAIKLIVDCVAAQQPEDQLIVDSINQSYQDLIGRLAAPAEATGPGEPAPSAETPVPQPSRLREKDELDLAWEKTFDISEQEPIPVEPLAEDIEKEQKPAPGKPGPAPTLPSPAPPVAPKAPAAPVVKGPGAQPRTPAPPAELAPVAQRPEASLKDEIEEAKKVGIVEKRGLGRRVVDAAEVEKQFIRVSIERLDNLMNLVG